MSKTKYKIFVLLLFISIYNCVKASQPGKNYGNGIRLNVGPAIGFYSINTNHAQNPQQRISAIIGFRKEIKVGRDYQTFFLIGVDYFFHGLNFKSYYFKPDSLKLYDKSFGYDYSLLIHELNLPLQFKYLLKRADNNLFSPYITIGYHLRFLLPPSLKISQNGNLIKTDNPDLKFKTPLFYDKLNSFISASLGWQKNSLSNSKGSFFVELNFRYGFSPYFFESNYAASSLYISSTHLSLQLGLKF